MPDTKEPARHRMVVEEVGAETKPEMEETKEPQVVSDEPKISSETVVSDHNEVINDVSDKPVKQRSPVFWILIPGIFILGAILGGVVFYQKGVNSIKVEETATPSATATPQASPTSSPSGTVDISKLKVSVLNGSGIAGEAGKVKALLETAGFTVTSTGNAATYDYTKTIIKAKSTVDAATLKKVKDALFETYLVGENQTLTASSATDIQVIVGTSKAQ